MDKKVNQKARSSTAKKGRKRSGQSDEHVHREIYAAIIDHRIAPGTPLQEDALASAFSVSRTVVRKVLQRLAHGRLVDLVPNKGAAVAKPSAEEAKHIFEARREIERVLVQRAVAHAKDTDIARLVSLAKLEQQAFDKQNKEERVKLSGEFHRQLARLCGNQVLSDFLAELVSRTSLIIALYESPGAVPCSHSEHLEIANAIQRRDSAKAVQYMDYHLRHIEAQIDLVETFQQAEFSALFSPEGAKGNA
jgi:DNA-binding GntR family transcriptional regulator